MNKVKYIGCLFGSKKKKKVNVDKLRQLFRKYGAELTEINFSKSLASQGPFDVIIHKLTDHMLDGTEKAKTLMLDVETYIKSNPEIVVIDPLDSIRKLLDRYETYKLIRSVKLCQSGKLDVPSFTLITTKNKGEILEQMKTRGVEFPFVCKKSVAHGVASHKMSLIFNEEGLKDVDPPCVAQTFINHGALLYKVYVIADKYHIVKRPSLRNFSKESLKDHKTIFFHSHDISSGESSRSNLTTPEKEDVVPAQPLNESVVKLLTKELFSELKMAMYGVDVIVCAETNKHFVIDVNVFPGYDGVPDFLDILVQHVMHRLGVLSENGLSATSVQHDVTNMEKCPMKNSVNSKELSQAKFANGNQAHVVSFKNEEEPKSKMPRHENHS